MKKIQNKYTLYINNFTNSSEKLMPSDSLPPTTQNNIAPELEVAAVLYLAHITAESFESRGSM
jgi:hypothetical protein